MVVAQTIVQTKGTTKVITHKKGLDEKSPKPLIYLELVRRFELLTG
jgi:hypothetical protein